MTRPQAEIVYGAILGAIFGPAYLIGKAMWAGDIMSAFNTGLIAAAVIGAIGGALAFMIRHWAR